ADYAIDVQNENAKEKVREYTKGKGADVVVDVSSYATEPVVDALSFVKPGGTIVLAGVKGYKPVPGFISDVIVMKEITIKGAIGVTSSGYTSAIELLEKRVIPFEKMHTHDFDLTDAELAIKTLAREIDGEESVHSCLIPGLK
ncbi:MAG TPA: alcohol dehydrogenase, partial [Alphaproteobacteria bacterium]|nr:alcohol dehydrogenase [Alphaproteobacteria bacterium]